MFETFFLKRTSRKTNWIRALNGLVVDHEIPDYEQLDKIFATFHPQMKLRVQGPPGVH